jgi:spore coat polysaccharide biosynthesis predicted glycosyltransferase SpsG
VTLNLLEEEFEKLIEEETKK